ncbi:heavy metal translocating P-type ATPase [Lusitaniella coriacea]|uniref:heavy metal translocating P-type ATPase n=1 Tax=Lusitaniella coriacea TaxID=1983105 RepID=UPI003CEA767F
MSHAHSNSSCPSCSHDHHHGHGKDFNLKRSLIPTVLASIPFVFGLIFYKFLHDTPYHIGEYLVFIPAYLISGWSILTQAGRNILRGRIFDENFLMTVTSIGAIAIHKLPEAVAVMVFFQVGELFQDYSVGRSRASIKTLLEIRPDVANLKVGNSIKTVSPEAVKIGDIILVKPGEKIPLDGEIIRGSAQIDTSPLTGESIPRLSEKGDTVLAGTIDKTGVLEIRVTKLFNDSSIARILELVETAQSKKAKAEKFITRFAKYYTPGVFLISLLVALIPPLIIPAATSTEWAYRALVLLAISCPCGLVISIPLGYFGGVGGAAKRGILVKGATFLDVLQKIDTVVFDKTGTLTEGKFKVTDVSPYNGFASSEILRLAAAGESYSNHPLAQAIRDACDEPLAEIEIGDYQEIAGQGIRARVGDRLVLVGNDRLLAREKISHPPLSNKGTQVHLAVDNAYVGSIAIADRLKPDAKAAIANLKALGVQKIAMLTGDRQPVAARVAEELGLNGYRAELLPEDKVGAIETIIYHAGERKKVVFVGDGINDAPVLARADVGIAMGALGSDAAIESADIVLMSDAPSKVAQAIQIARKTNRIVWQNIALALSIKGFFMLLGIWGLATLWEAVFADVGVALLAILNATRARN